MTAIQMILIALHAVPGVFWAGSTFALARSPLGMGDTALGPAQMGAAVITVLAGLAMWGINHRSGFGAEEWVLAIGALCSIVAAGLQSGMAWPARRRLTKLTLMATPEAAADRRRVEVGQRAAAALLVITVIAMVVWRYL